MKDPTAFRERFSAYKNGEMPYENGLPKYANGKRGHIGGSTKQARETVWNTDQVLKNAVDSIANEYQLKDGLLQHRLNEEGFTDKTIRLYNNAKNQSLYTGENLLNNKTDFSGVGDFGLDDAGTMILNNQMQLKGERWWDEEGENEQGRITHGAVGDTVRDTIGIQASALKYFSDQVKKDYPNLSDYDNARYTQAYYQRGVGGGRKWAKAGAKGYNFSTKPLAMRPAETPYQMQTTIQSTAAPKFGKYANGKLPQFKDGDIPYITSDGVQYNINPNVVGAEQLNVRVPEVVVTGTDRRPMYQRYDAEHSAYDPEVIRTFTDWAPVVGDIGQGLDAYNAFKNQNYLQAGLLGGALLLPNIIEKPLKYIGKAYIASMMRNPKIRNLSPTERIFAALGKNVPKDQYVGNKIGMALMSQSPTIKHLRSQGVDTSLLSPEDLKQLLELRKRSIQDPHLMGRRASVDTDLSQVKVFDGEIDANGDFWPIGDATFDHKPISGQNAFVSAIQDGPNKVPYSEFLDDNLRGIHMIHNYSIYPELKGVVSPRKHVAQDIYNVAIDHLRNSGKGIGLYSGKELLTPQATMRTVTPENYRMITFPDTGVWRYDGKTQVGDSWAVFEPKSQVIPYKNIELFNINNIDNLGNFGIDWTRGSAYKDGKLPAFKDGKSPIHINPANRGKFNATKKRTGKTTEELAHSKNPLTRKRAIFALNARKWKH